MILKLKQAWLWIKLHWTYLLSGVLGLVGVVIALEKGSEASKLLNDLNKQALQHKSDIEKLQRIQQENSERVVRIEETYRATISRIETERQTLLQEVTNSQRSQVRTIVEQTHDNPVEMARQLQETFGLNIFPPSP